MIYNMTVSGLRITVDNYAAIQGYKHVVRPELVMLNRNLLHKGYKRKYIGGLTRALMVYTGLSFFLQS